MIRGEMVKRANLLIAALLVLSGCSPLSSIPYRPTQTPANWLEMQPFIRLKVGVSGLILVQPSSTMFVYLLGLLAIGVGIYFFQIQPLQQSRKWWGIALILWGFGALLAGTSYQAFSYEIKCAGRAVCSWTSWWEVIYLLLSVASIDAMLMATAYSCCFGKWRIAIKYYAYLNISLYVIAVFVGVFSLNKFLISFELLLLVAAPNIILLFVINGLRYIRLKNSLDLALFITWIWLGIVIAAYYLYFTLDISNKLWQQGVWFTENDVLHIGLISWISYIGLALARRVVDYPQLVPENSRL
jgi:hypothetical protein